MTTFNVFSSSTNHRVEPHLFLAQVDAADRSDAIFAVARDLGIDSEYIALLTLSAQFADDPRAHGQRHATAAERIELARI